ncbi:CE1759 family FMN reductase [Streptomyces sp. NPDC048277]|uniref:CE1759 family FMN reductase n=1 Tax=Streptomyces sp. NPDC048277 TaxID=3155027 RepID=UPI00340F8B4C
MIPYSIVSVSAGLRRPSTSRKLADRLTEAAAAELTTHGGKVRVRSIELRDHAHDITDALLTGRATAELADTVQAVARADALVAVTPVFTGAYSGLFKSFVDILDKDSLGGRLVLLGATGGSARHQLALEYSLRPLFTHLRAETVPTAVFAAPEDWEPDGETRLSERIGHAARELASHLHSRVGLQHTF